MHLQHAYKSLCLLDVFCDFIYCSSCYFLAFWRPQRAPAARRPSITQSTDTNVFSVSRTKHHFSWSGQVFGTRSCVELPLFLSLFPSLSVCWFGADVFTCRHIKLHVLQVKRELYLCFPSLWNFSLIPLSCCYFFCMNASVRGNDVSPTLEANFPYLLMW